MKRLSNLFGATLILCLVVTMAMSPFARKAEAATGTNLIANSSFETASNNLPTNWQTGGWGTNTASFAYQNTGHTGTHSASVTMSKYTDGDEKWFADTVPVIAGEQYVYSDYYTSTAANEVVVQFDDGAGHYTYLGLATPAKVAAWTAYSGTFTVPKTAKNATVFHLINAVGTLQIDDVSLTQVLPDPPAADGNLIPNSSFETANPADATAPNKWIKGTWGTNATTFSYLKTGHTGTRSAKATVTSYTSGASEWYSAPQAVTPGMEYSFSDYYQSNVSTEVEVGIDMSDGSTQYVTLGKPYSSTTWNYFFGQLTMPAGAVSATVYHMIYNVGYLTVDDLDFKPYAQVGFNRPIVSLTFDDAWKNEYTNGLPILNKYGFKSTFYILTGDLNTDPEYMTNAMVKDLYKQGNEIGSHTVTHPDLTTLTKAQVNTELTKSQTKIQNLIGVPVTDFATPYGSYNGAVLTAIQKNYTLHRTTDEGYNSKDNYNPMTIRVQNLLSTTTLAEYQSWVNHAIATNTWLVLVYHQIGSDPTALPYSNLPAELDAQLGYLKSTGVTVESVSKAAAEVKSQL